MGEIWKDIQNWEGYYQISNHGRVKTMPRTLIMSDGRRKTIKEKVLAVRFCTNGYVKTDLHKDKVPHSFLVHRLVAFHFLNEQSELNEINHIDGVKSNNHVNNLEWSNRSRNVKHAFDTGLRKTIGFKGVENRQSKLTDELVREIRANKGLQNISQMSIKYKVSRQVIFSVLNRKTWKHVE